MNFHHLSIEETLSQLKVTPTGLTSKEAEKRQKEWGKNCLESKKKKSLLARFLSQFCDFMILILMVAAVISFFVSYLEGHTDFVDPIIIFAIILLNATLGVIQEAKAERSLEALKKMSAPNAMVYRDGVIQTLPSESLVPGDVIVLETGHYIPADGRLLTAVNLKVDESSLTGESHPVEKNAASILKENTMLGDQINMAPATGIVTYGRGTAVVTATGMNTQVGNIAKLIMNDETPQTPLQKRLAKTSKTLGIVALFICVIIFVLGLLKSRPPFDMFMTSVSLAVAAIPDGFIKLVLLISILIIFKNNLNVKRTSKNRRSLSFSLINL